MTQLLNPRKNYLLTACLLILCITHTRAINTIYTTDYSIVNTWVREGAQYYTEGLFFLNPTTLVESAGLYGKSSIHLLSFPTLKVTVSHSLGAQYFSEGIAPISIGGENKVYQLTWQEKTVFIYNPTTLAELGTMAIPATINQGWGMTVGSYTANGKTITAFYVSNGSSNIYVVDPSNFEVLKTIPVKERNGSKITELNELEMINGKIWANIYLTNYIAIIDPTTGYADTIVDLSYLETLAKAEANKMGLSINSGDVLNGIAYDAVNNRVVVTGKMWPLMWQIDVKNIQN